LDNLQSISNQLNAAVAVEEGLKRRLLQVDKEKSDAIEAAAGMADQLQALEKEFEAAKNYEQTAVTSNAPSAPVPALGSNEEQRGLKNITDLTVPASPKQPVLQAEQLSSVSGTVREVNAKFGFVVLDVGIHNGVKPGDLFSVLRDNMPVGQLRVRKLHSGLPVCDIIADMTTMTILQGDKVHRLK